MIQINLLPDIKREYLRARQVKHTVIVVAMIASIVALIFAGLLLSYVHIVQAQHTRNLQKDIDEGVQAQVNHPDAMEMVTVQGVLEQIGGLQDNKLLISRLPSYVINFTPRDVVYSSITYDSLTQTLALSGRASRYDDTNELANNIKSARFTYQQNDNKSTISPFSSLVFTSLSTGEGAEDGRNISFSLTLQIDTILFSESISGGELKVNASSRDLLIPSKNTLFQEVDQPSQGPNQLDEQRGVVQ